MRVLIGGKPMGIFTKKLDVFLCRIVLSHIEVPCPEPPGGDETGEWKVVSWLFRDLQIVPLVCSFL